MTANKRIDLTAVINALACASFFFGSMLFLPKFSDYATQGVWLFMLGSVLMFLTSAAAISQKG